MKTHHRVVLSPHFLSLSIALSFLLCPHHHHLFLPCYRCRVTVIVVVIAIVLMVAIVLYIFTLIVTIIFNFIVSCIVSVIVISFTDQDAGLLSLSLS